MRIKCPKCKNKKPYLLAFLGTIKKPIGKCRKCGFEGFLEKRVN